jgi:hypothetical protein
MDPFTLALLGSTAASALSSGAGYAASQRAAGTQAQAAQQGGMLGYLAQQQALEQARQMAEKGAAAGAEYYGKGRADLLEQGRQGAETAREFYGKGVGFQEPYMQGGAGAFNQLAALYGPGGAYTQQPTYEQIQLDPAYEFLKQQGQQATTNAARAGGLAGSGSALKAAERFGQGLASQEYSNAYNRFMANRLAVTQGLQNIAGTGANAAQISSQLAGTTGGQLSGNQFNLGSNLGTMASNAGGTVAGAYTGIAPTIASLASANPYGQGVENAAAARASGYMGGASALQGALQTPVNAMMAYGMADRFAPQGATGSYQFGGQNVPYFGRPSIYG